MCGDSGNDIELFAVPGVRGCMVANAHPELREYCDAHASDNIFQVPAVLLAPPFQLGLMNECLPLHVCSASACFDLCIVRGIHPDRVKAVRPCCVPCRPQRGAPAELLRRLSTSSWRSRFDVS